MNNLRTWLDTAIAEDRFELFAQPIVASNNLHAAPERYEVLTRMRNAEGDIVSPGSFIPQVEAKGLMPRFDRHILSKTCKALAQGDRSKFATLAYLTVNASAQTFGEEDFAAFALSVITASGIAADKVCLELTESAPITDVAVVRANIEQLRAAGVRVALDDFGTGYATQAVAEALPLDVIKLDGSIVKPVVECERTQARIRSVCDQARAANRVVVAEFVSSPEMAHTLALLGVDYVQGYGVGKPAPL